jgi:hypothetical protein
MPVGELLSRMSAYELTEWEAYERATGPLGRAYEADVLATLVDAWLTTEKHEHHHPRPHEIFRLADKIKEAEDQEKETPLADRLAAFDKAAGLA